MHKILLIKRGAMGDILMTTPLIRQLRHNLPDAQIDYCMAYPFKSILAKNKYISTLMPLDDKIFAGSGILRLIKFIFNIRNKYDYIFILGKSWQFNLIASIFRGCRIGYARDKISKLLLNKYVVYNDVTRYHVLYYLDLLQISGLAPANYNDIKLDLTIKPADECFLRDKFAALKLDKFVVVVNSGGNNQYESGGVRMLPEAKALELLESLLRNHTVILLGSNSDRTVYQDYIKKLNYPPQLFNWAGELSLAQSAYLISLAEHFYTTDCGAMHLGVAMNLRAKMTCFFGPTHPKHVLPHESGINIYWNDQELFDPTYPLYGKLKHKNTQYFTKVILKQIGAAMA